MRWLWGITYSKDIHLNKLLVIVVDRGAWHAAVCGIAESDMIKWLKNNKYMSDTLLDTGDRAVNRNLKFVSSCTFPVNRREWQNVEQVRTVCLNWVSCLQTLPLTPPPCCIHLHPKALLFIFQILFPEFLLPSLTLLKSSQFFCYPNVLVPQSRLLNLLFSRVVSSSLSATLTYNNCSPS